jgi:membrane protein YqaA with SNARE-associated domain
MRAFSQWVIALCTTPIGIVVLAALDSTLVLFLPLGIDIATVILAAKLRHSWWTVPLLATAGSVAGAAFTFWLGTKAGEKGLDRYVPKKRLKKIRSRIHNRGAVALAVLDLVPPPFPFTAFVLAAGALKVKKTTFFATLVACRLIRFGLEATLAATYGGRIVSWLESDLLYDIASFFIGLALLVSVISIIRLIRSSRPQKRRAVAA